MRWFWVLVSKQNSVGITSKNTMVGILTFCQPCVAAARVLPICRRKKCKECLLTWKMLGYKFGWLHELKAVIHFITLIRLVTTLHCLFWQIEPQTNKTKSDSQTRTRYQPQVLLQINPCPTTATSHVIPMLSAWSQRAIILSFARAGRQAAASFSKP